MVYKSYSISGLDVTNTTEFVSPEMCGCYSCLYRNLFDISRKSNLYSRGYKSLQPITPVSVSTLQKLFSHHIFLLLSSESCLSIASLLAAAKAIDSCEHRRECRSVCPPWLLVSILYCSLGYRMLAWPGAVARVVDQGKRWTA
jgi:hypothetical protein